jgi:hypothetical protein
VLRRTDLPTEARRQVIETLAATGPPILAVLEQELAAGGMCRRKFIARFCRP